MSTETTVWIGEPIRFSATVCPTCEARVDVPPTPMVFRWTDAGLEMFMQVHAPHMCRGFR